MRKEIISAKEAKDLLNKKKEETSNQTEEDKNWNEVVSYIEWGIQNTKDCVFIDHSKISRELRKALEEKGYRVEGPYYIYGIRDFTVGIFF